MRDDGTPSAELCVLTSGSSGNATLLRVGATLLLIDAGTPLRWLQGAMGRLGVRVEDLTAVLITHEHGDHAGALPELRAARPSLPIYTTRGTARAFSQTARDVIDRPILRSGRPERIGDVRVLPFDVAHDAAEPVGYRIDHGDFSLGLATDIGSVTAGVRRALSRCRVLVVESNHDRRLLAEGPYPRFLKRRVAGAKGHLSNQQTADLLSEVHWAGLEHIVLAHLSAQNNSPERAEGAAGAALAVFGSTAEIVCAGRRRPSDVWRFDVTAVDPVPVDAVAAPVRAKRARQLRMF